MNTKRDLQSCHCNEASCYQGWEFAYLLIRSKSLILMSDCVQFAQIAQFKWATVSKSLMTNEERIAQVAHHKRATVSDSLRALMENERFAGFFANRSFALSLTKYMRFAQQIWIKSYFMYVLKNVDQSANLFLRLKTSIQDTVILKGA